MGSVATRPGRSPALLKSSKDSLTSVVPSPREALQPFSAVVVTGGSSGIGKSIIRLGRTVRPDLVFCNLSRRPPVLNISPNAGKYLNHFPCDLSVPEELIRAAAAVRALLERDVPTGRILLINNSGIGTFGPFPKANLDRELAMIDLNVRGVVQLTGLLLPLLQARGGAIINLASTVAFQPTPFAATYGASKAFILHWTIALNEELRGTNVHALAVCPGTTSTEFFRNAAVGDAAAESALTMTPDDVAEATLRALGAGRSQIVPGLANKLYTFFGSKLPKALGARVAGAVLGRRWRRQAQS
uniref:SDR family NAD(P)-dependent oxidoreductase n=1 Tax=Horticoccus sp. 23ND18S-11 TaxID=3391832 RepID=UPI0039C91BBA